MTRFLAAARPFAQLVVFLLAAAESAAFVGLVVPGELAVILGGVAAGTGSVSLWVMIPAAVGGANRVTRSGTAWERHSARPCCNASG